MQITFLNLCDPDWIRTNDLLLRRQLLYPTELPDHFFKCAANLRHFFKNSSKNTEGVKKVFSFVAICYFSVALLQNNDE